MNIQNVKKRYFTIKTCASNVKATLFAFEHHIPLVYLLFRSTGQHWYYSGINSDIVVELAVLCISPYQISKDLFDVLSYIRLPNMLGNVPHFTCQDSFVESVYHFIETSGLPRKIEQNTCTQMAIDFSEEITFGNKSYNTSIFT